MRRILLVLTVAALMVAMLVAAGGNAWAFNPQPDPPGSEFDGHDDVAVADSERFLGGPDTYGDLETVGNPNERLAAFSTGDTG
jgi:hypothetical protein